MIKALYQLGKYQKFISNKSGVSAILDIPNVDNILYINFRTLEDKTDYLGINEEEYSINKTEELMYKKGSSRGGNITPTLILDKTDIHKSLRNFMLPIKRIDIDGYNTIIDFMGDEKNFNTIAEDINNLVSQDKKYALSLQLNGKKLNDYQELEKVLLNNESSKYNFRTAFNKDEQCSIASDKICYVCKQEKEQINGFTNTFNFYTVDKPGFMTGGFNRKYAWRNYPVCSECGTILELGKRYLEDNLSDYFAGFTYFLVPKFIFNIDIDNNFKQYNRIMDKLKKNKEITLSKSNEKGLIKREPGILRAAANLENNVSFNIMFYRSHNSEFKILENIEDVYPSRLSYLLQIKKQLEDTNKYPEFNSIQVNKDKNNIEAIEFSFNFSILKYFFTNYDNHFLEIVHDIFAGKKIDYKFIIKRLINTIIKKENEDGNSKLITINSWLVLNYLNEAKLLNNINDTEVKSLIKSSDNKYIGFIDAHKEILNTDAKIGIFLEGILTKLLLNIQYANSNSKPFYNRLNGLKLNEKLVKRILTEVINKLNEYDKNYYVELETLISEYFINANFNAISDDEMSYFFVLGMNLADKFNTKENKTSDEEDK
ncbi:TIGR02556 family CRISPR-associated protein [Vallitalea guaymasensis]|uniref:TIGR02556 family CRISPR-associated protein n=1 Tax=Vallitalea guaymasensis TaxID=1185412 RepID=UPI00235290D5|nr:TIGR02556 family CRISPR-associated protein [Vallitalea guaymasensis]